jgi:aminoglycoside phosphotransferase (APT) family kinase protein
VAPSETPGPLIGSGRSADVYALGDGKVLRRYRPVTPAVTELVSRGALGDVRAEAEIMRYLGSQGFPVPEVYGADGPDLVLERLDGRDMLAEIGRRPWTIGRHARMLADLHNRLHQIRAPAGLRQTAGPGDRVLHLDLHPGNVMLTSRGPVVIDWSNAHAGPAGADVAMAYVIMATSETDLIPPLLRPVVGLLRAVLFRSFLATVTDDPAPHLARIARARTEDPNCRPSERERLLRMAARAESRG